MTARKAFDRLKIAKLDKPNLDHDSQDLQRLAHAVLLQAVKDLQSSSADIYGPAWDFLTGKTPEDKQDLQFWADNARIDVKIIGEWAERYEQNRTEQKA
jgi:hypothetical protein